MNEVTSRRAVLMGAISTATTLSVTPARVPTGSIASSPTLKTGTRSS